MTDAHLSHPLGDPGDEPVVMHDDFIQIAGDTLRSYQAVCVLMDLLNGDSPEDLGPEERAGLSVLLEGTRYRLELAVDGLAAMGRTLGIPVRSALAAAG